MRSQTELPLMSTELQSSETPRVTTETTIGWPWGEYSKQSLAHSASCAYRNSVPASYVAANSTVTFAWRVKVGSGGTKRAIGAFS